jgi:putative transcriptional regulator
MADSPMTGSLRGQLLVATPLLTESTFLRTVILVLEHTPEGALGVVLNRPGTSELLDSLGDWADLAAPPAQVFSGGPVGPDAALALAEAVPLVEPGGRLRELPRGFVPLTSLGSGTVGTVDLGRPPADIVPQVRRVRVFAGYSGWGPGQLEVEMDEHAWFAVEATTDDPWTATPEELWRAVLRRQPGAVAQFAWYPEDGRAN